ncbi:MAG: transcription-repair coupling factor, partial [Oscillospiraceae bacterium]|nr:transcription-repair coupling factor [Oscillospiraceae bacterium]
CPDEGEASRLAADVCAFSQKPAAVLSAREFTFYDAATVSRQWEHRRLKTLYDMAEGHVSFVAATVDGLLQKTMPKHVLLDASILLRQGKSYDLGQLTTQLARIGYENCAQVEGPGQFALRGGILDVFSPGEELPVRAEFFGDEIDSMGLFDPRTQRRTENCRNALLLPAAETLPGLHSAGQDGFLQRLSSLKDRIQKRKGNFTALLSTLNRDIELLSQKASFPSADRYLGLIYGEAACGADYIPADAILLYTESGRTAERANGYLWQLEQDMEFLVENGLLAGEIADFALSFDAFHDKIQNYPLVFADSFAVSRYPLRPRSTFSLSCKQLPSYGGNLETAASDLQSYLEADFSIVVLCPTERRVQGLHTLLREKKLKAAVDFQLHALPAPGKAVLSLGNLSSGMEYPEQKFAVLTEGQISTAVPRKKPAKTITNRQKLGSYADLSPGDLVVHAYHGIGRFVEMAKLPVDGVEKDYIKLAYAGSDCLYIPATQLDLVSKYIGGGEETPARLNKLGGTDWAKAKSRAKSAARDLAKGLIALYAQRQRQPGFAFSPDSPWQREFEESFEYQETEDQLRCIAEIKADMEQTVPMDRLLCGDVGYGKTEVALRAVMKCVLDGRQAAILVPTTVLAQQHYTSMLARFRNFPIKIDVLSRFRTSAQMKNTISAVKAGNVDVLVGTHRLLQKDLVFHDLGLLVVDEEQRFGVSHKERLKELSRQVDVLTLTATPIPRTLNMALSGLRDMSTIEEPPADRQPVQTYVLEHNWSVLADAIRRELGRGGQIYYLHNRVETIDRVAAHIDGMFPEAAVATAHGQMSAEMLDQVMSQMSEGAVQILVCTTIIETGIDIPNVNTLIIEDADKLGLAQLHQIRGRVGRSHRRAYAYMTYRQGKILTEVATKRLSAIREFAAFGSGFKIAMRDLEIRGAGNLLGPEQSGYMMSVGYDMYLKLLEEAVMEEQGTAPAQKAECAADLIVSANIPESYVPSPEQRMDLYRRIASIRSEEEADDLYDELLDRYGDPPESVGALISVALLRVDAAEAGIMEISQKGMNLHFFLYKPDLQRVSALCALPKYRGRLLFSAGDRPYLSLRIKKGEDVVRLSKSLAEEFGAL